MQPECLSDFRDETVFVEVAETIHPIPTEGFRFGNSDQLMLLHNTNTESQGPFFYFLTSLTNLKSYLKVKSCRKLPEIIVCGVIFWSSQFEVRNCLR